MIMIMLIMMMDARTCLLGRHTRKHRRRQDQRCHHVQRVLLHDAEGIARHTEVVLACSYRHGYGQYSHGLCSYSLYGYGLCSYGLYSYGLCSYGL